MARDVPRSQGRLIYPMPMPETIGVTLEADQVAKVKAVEITMRVGTPEVSNAEPSCKLHVVHEPQSARPITADCTSPNSFWRVSVETSRLGVGLA